MMVSVIMPIYNGQKTMRVAIESILNQSYQDIQVILVDDGSSDQSLQIIQEYANSDFRVKYCSQKNKGQAAARNVGLRLAQGKFVLFVDCDDSLETTAVEELVTCIESKPKASFVLFGFNVYSDKQLLRTPNPGDGYYKPGDGYLAFLPVKKLMESPCNKLYHREYIEQMFDESLVFGEDGIFNYSNFKEDTEVVLCSKCFYNVQLGTENSVNKRYKKGKLLNLLQARDVQEKVCEKIFKNEFDRKAFRIKELSTISFVVYTCCIKLKKKEAVKELESVLEESKYLETMLENVGSTRMQDKFLLIPLIKRRYSSVIIRSKLLCVLRGVAGKRG